jgi:nitrile hydratase
MNGVHDLGGMHGFGPVVPEPDEPPFHQPWEGRVLGLQRSVLYTRAWNIDRFRHAQERLPAAVYLTVSYYHRWLLAVTQGALDTGLAEADELAAGHALRPALPVARALTPDTAGVACIRGPFGRTPQGAARFQPGDRVRTKNIHPVGHTRLPRYARDKVGTVDVVHGCPAFPDAVAAGQGDAGEWLYAVVFRGTDLWGDAADPALTVSIDAFEPYLEPA